MRVKVWDNLGHGYKSDGELVERLTDLKNFENTWQNATLLAIHAGEKARSPKPLEEVLGRILQETILPVALFSGGGVRAANELGLVFQEYLGKRVIPMSDSEFTLRLGRALQDQPNHIAHLVCPARLPVATGILSAMWTFQLQLAEGKNEEELKMMRLDVRERFRMLDSQPGPPVPSPFDNGTPLTSKIVNEILLTYTSSRDADGFCEDLRLIRDALLQWAGS